MSRRGRWCAVLGVYALLSALVSAVYYGVNYSSGFSELLWYCDLALIFLGIGLFRGDTKLLSLVLVTAVPFQFFWIWGDILYFLGVETLGRYRWLSEDFAGLGMWFDLNYHFSIIPIAFYGVRRYGYDRRAWKWACLFLLALFVTSRYLTRPGDNVNCAFFPCDEAYTEAAVVRHGLTYAVKRTLGFMLACGVLHAAFVGFFRKTRLADLKG